MQFCGTYRIFDGMNYAGYQLDYVFDWTISKYPQVGSSSRPRVSPIIDFTCGEPNLRIIKQTPKILSCYCYVCVCHSQQPNPRPALDPPGPPAERAEKPTGTLIFSVSYIRGTYTKRNIKNCLIACTFMRLSVDYFRCQKTDYPLNLQILIFI